MEMLMRVELSLSMMM